MHGIHEAIVTLSMAKTAVAAKCRSDTARFSLLFRLAMRRVFQADGIACGKRWGSVDAPPNTEERTTLASFATPDFQVSESRLEAVVNAVAAALVGLSVTDMAVLLCRQFEEMENQWIARRLRLTRSAVKSRYARALTKVRTQLAVPARPALKLVRGQGKREVEPRWRRRPTREAQKG